MLIVQSKIELKNIIAGWKSAGLRVGFVPTMGALHEGHLSLINLAKKNADKIIVSIFVNPAQFAPHEDFDVYPRNEKSDLEKLERTGVDLVYLPSAAEIYPGGIVSDIKAGPAAQGLESDFRPHFFDGVLSVVSRLFDHVQPDIAVFGEKDYQQLMVIKEFVEGRKLPITIIPGPTARDEHGLALSSRNVYLSPEELKIARKLNVILKEAAITLARHCEEPQATKQSSADSRLLRCARNDDVETARTKLLAAGFNEVQYLEIRWNRLLAAVNLGRTRLIDNLEISIAYK